MSDLDLDFVRPKEPIMAYRSMIESTPGIFSDEEFLEMTTRRGTIPRFVAFGIFAAICRALRG